MKSLLGAMLLMTGAAFAASSVHEFTLDSITGTPTPLANYKGKVMLLVNVASQCGATPQYKQLEELNAEYKDQGLSVLGFPCNQFGGQEPGTEEEIVKFCKTKYDVKFDMFSKVDVNGDDAAPFFKELTADRKSTRLNSSH